MYWVSGDDTDRLWEDENVDDYEISAFPDQKVEQQER